MANKNLKELYPSDWVEHKFNTLFKFEGGMPISRAKLSDEGVCYLHYGDIHKSNDNHIDVEENFDAIPKLKISIDEIKDKYILNDGDIVFADASEDYEAIGKSVVVVNKSNIPFVSGLHTIVARDKTGLLDNGYKRYFLSDWNIRKQIMILATGISVLGISKENIKDVEVVLPPLKEQNKIATILSVWDKAINLKEKLIEQKKEQKKGLMQKLLTGEVRLLGFTGEWAKVKLGGVIEECKDRTTENNQYSVLTSSRQGIFLQEDYFSKQVASKDNIGYKIVRKGEFTYRSMSDDGLFVFNRLDDYEVGIVSPAYVVFRAKEINSTFLKEFINSNMFRRYMIKYIQGGTRVSYKYKDLHNTVVELPTIEEQNAIAKVVTIADENIELLEKELSELKQQKKGLMQLLLTGKVRVRV